MMEIYKDIPDYEGYYQVSNTGHIRSVDRIVDGNGLGQKNRLLRSKLMKVSIDHAGYAFVALTKTNKTKHFRVHRLLMLSFAYKDGCEQLDVNHINGIKTDNRIENLEWTTRGENLAHRYQVLNQPHSMTGKFGALHHRSIPVVGVNLLGNIVCKFDSLMDAQRAGFLASRISDCLSGKRKTHGGLHWQAPNLRGFI